MLNQRVKTDRIYSNQPRNQQSISTLSEGSEGSKAGNGIEKKTEKNPFPDFVVFCQLKFWHLIISSLENIFLAIWVTQGFFVPLQHVRAKEEKPFWVCQRSGC